MNWQAIGAIIASCVFVVSMATVVLSAVRSNERLRVQFERHEVLDNERHENSQEMLSEIRGDVKKLLER